jgi:hypothetical protein
MGVIGGDVLRAFMTTRTGGGGIDADDGNRSMNSIK